MSDDRTQLACPDCGSTRFGWTITQVEFGQIYEYHSSDRAGLPKKGGPYVDTSTEVTCTHCESEHNRDDLDLLTDTGDDNE